MIVLYLLLAVVVLLFMVLVHELGHYVVGRILKFKIEEFSIGFGKAIFSKTNKRGEKISLRIFPLGGYCAFAGEDGNDKDGKPITDNSAFTNQKPWKRILVFLAGVSFNFLTAIIFSFILLVSVGYDIPRYQKPITFQHVINYELSENYNPELNSLQEGDVVFYVNGTKVDFAYSYNFSDLVSMEVKNLETWLKDNPDKSFKDHPAVKYSLRRDGEMMDVDMYFTKVTYLVFDSEGKPVYEYERDENNNIVKDENGQNKFKLDEEGNKIQQTNTAYALGGYMLIGEDGNPVLDENGQMTLMYLHYEPYRHSFVEALARCIPFAFGLAWIVLKSLWMLITFQVSISQIGGPIATITMIASVAQQSMTNLLVLIPLISANLAVFNLLPIPALDGAHVVFTTIEWIRKKPIKREIEKMIHSIGLMVLFGLVILIDILHFVL